MDAYAYSPKEAAQLLKAAGWEKGSDGVLVKNGKKFSFTLTVGQNGVLVPSAQLIQSYLKKIGMDASLNIMEWNSMIRRVIVQRNYDASIAWWIYAPDPDMYPYLASTAASTGNNIPDFKDKHLDSILLKGALDRQPGETTSHLLPDAAICGEGATVQLPLVSKGGTGPEQKVAGCPKDWFARRHELHQQVVHGEVVFALVTTDRLRASLLARGARVVRNQR